MYVLTLDWYEFWDGIMIFLMNPLLYWFVIYALLISLFRIKKERKQFGFKLKPLFAEVSSTFFLSLFAFAMTTLVFLYLELTLSLSIVFVITTMVILLSIFGHLSMLSSVYTLSLSYITLFIVYGIHATYEVPFLAGFVLEPIFFTSLIILMGLFLIIESLLLSQAKNHNFPEQIKSARGLTVGQHRFKRLMFVPFFTYIPVSDVFLHFPFLPYITINSEQYLILLIPFMIGINYKIVCETVDQAIHRLKRQTLILGLVILMLGLSSIKYPILSILAVMLAVVGKEWIVYRQSKKNYVEGNIYQPHKDGLTVLSTRDNSPAQALGILEGEIITRVNFKEVYNRQSFYEALQRSGPSYKLEIKDQNNEIRFIHSVLYEADTHELGLIFVEKNI